MIDISGSMTGHKIAAVTDALENIKESLLDYSYDNGPVRVCIELFSREVRWLDEQFVTIDKFQWEEPFCTGMTSLGKACTSLADFLQGNKFSESIKIVLISDGCPTDDYEEGLGNLNDLIVFGNSDRYAIGLGEEADIPSLTEFTDDVNKVFRVTELDKLLDCLTNAIIESQPPVQPNEPASNPESSESDEWA